MPLCPFFIMFIYCIKNTVNDKCYIGQTVQESTRRFQEHKKHLRRDKHHNAHLQHSWNKYGESSFQFKRLEEDFDSIEELNEAEKFWIQFLRTLNPESGYNSRTGGENYYLSQHLKDRIAKGVSQPVCKYSLDGELLNIYDSIKEAAEDHNGSIGNIVTCLNGRTKTAYDFQWKRLTNDSKENIDSIGSWIDRKRNKGESKVTKQYSLKGELIDVFASASEAGRQTDCNATAIRAACKGRYNTSGGYQWRYEGSDREVEDLGDYTPPSNEKKPVVKKDEEGNIIQKWESARGCARDLGVSQFCIRHRCENNSFHFWYFNKD